jgi:hypothetical protein
LAHCRLRRWQDFGQWHDPRYLKPPGFACTKTGIQRTKSNACCLWTETSYGAELATDFGRDVRSVVASEQYQALFPAVSLAEDSRAKNRWHTAHGGVYVAAGVGGPLTGRGAHILNIDDPLKDREEADSDVIREKVWNWYRAVAYTRLQPGGAVILTMTCWHPDDLAGRLLGNQVGLDLVSLCLCQSLGDVVRARSSPHPHSC